MSANDPGLPAVSGLDPEVVKAKEAAVEGVGKEDVGEEDVNVAPDQFDEKYRTTEWEIQAYYCYCMGNNGLTLFSSPPPLRPAHHISQHIPNPQDFAPTAFQNLLCQAAGSNSTLPFAGRPCTINSIVLLSNGISFALQVLIFLCLGVFADFGSWRPNILIVLSALAYGFGFGWLGVHTQEKQRVGAALYVVGLVAYQTALTYWAAAFPGLARNSEELRENAEELRQGRIGRDEYDTADMIRRI